MLICKVTIYNKFRNKYLYQRIQNVFSLEFLFEQYAMYIINIIDHEHTI